MATSYAGYVGISKSESSWGTAQTISHYLDATEESIALEIQSLRSEAKGGGRGIAKTLTGNKLVNGTLSGELNPIGIGYVLKSVLGSVTTTQPDGITYPTVYQHEFKGTNTTELPSFTIEAGIEHFAKQSVGCVANTLSISATAGEIASFSSDIIAKDQSEVSVSTPTLTTVDSFTFKDGSVTISGGSYTGGNINDITIDITNNAESRTYIGGTDTIGKIAAGRREITGTMTVDFENNDIYQDFINSVEWDFNLTFTGATIDGPYNYQLEIDMNKVRIETAPHNLTGEGILTAEISFVAEVDNSGDDIIATLTNDVDSY